MTRKTQYAQWPGRFGLIGLAAVLTSGSLAAQPQTDLRGVMSRYTDNSFGFSFWYPTAWKVTVVPLADATRGGWFPDARIVKELRVDNPATSAEDNQPPGVIIDEVVAPAGLTELGSSMSPSPVGIDQRYFFDHATHQWMVKQLSLLPDGEAPATAPIKIAQRTMGGLPMWFGAVRGGAEMIVPLDESHFLSIITMEYGGPNTHTYLAQTLTAAHAASNKEVSEHVQQEAIRREAVKLGAIGVLTGNWYKDSEYVYNLDGGVLPGANPKTFVVLSFPGSPAQDEESFATDGVRVYRANSGLIQGADPKTFVVLGPFTAKDAHHTYDWTSGKPEGKREGHRRAPLTAPSVAHTEKAQIRAAGEECCSRLD